MSYHYSVGISPSAPYNQAVILHKKPSEIPYGIDQDLTHVCGSFIHFLDVPNNKVYYEACGKNSAAVLNRMLAYLASCGWEKIAS